MIPPSKRSATCRSFRGCRGARRDRSRTADQRNRLFPCQALRGKDCEVSQGRSQIAVIARHVKARSLAPLPKRQSPVRCCTVRERTQEPVSDTRFPNSITRRPRHSDRLLPGDVRRRHAAHFLPSDAITPWRSPNAASRVSQRVPSSNIRTAPGSPPHRSFGKSGVEWGGYRVRPCRRDHAVPL